MHPPWHMWGNTQTVELISTGADATVVQPQLVRIAYGRPETWSFFFHAVCLDKVDPSGVNTGVVQVRYNLTLGVGRSHVSITDFEIYIWGTLPIIGQEKYSGSVVGPDRSAALTGQNVIDKIPAQDVQMNAYCILTGMAPAGAKVTLAVSAFFAPRSHIRPEWFKGIIAHGEDRSQ